MPFASKWRGKRRHTPPREASSRLLLRPRHAMATEVECVAFWFDFFSILSALGVAVFAMSTDWLRTLDRRYQTFRGSLRTLSEHYRRDSGEQFRVRLEEGRLRYEVSPETLLLPGWRMVRYAWPDDDFSVRVRHLGRPYKSSRAAAWPSSLEDMQELPHLVRFRWLARRITPSEAPVPRLNASVDPREESARSLRWNLERMAAHGLRLLSKSWWLHAGRITGIALTGVGGIAALAVLVASRL